MPATPLSAELHHLLVRPTNTSLLLGLAHHMGYRPANALASAATGRSLPRFADPDAWGAAANRVGEKLDFMLAPKGVSRTESLTLDHSHLKEIGAHLASAKQSDPSHAAHLENTLNSVVRDHYNKTESIQGLVDKAHADENFKATLHGVVVPSLTGEVGRFAKNIATDAAAMWGASDILNHVSRATQPKGAVEPDSQEKKATMSNLEHAMQLIEKTAQLLESIPGKEKAFKMASELVEANVVTPDEAVKLAATFERNPEDAQMLYDGMLRGHDLEGKSANLGEPFIEERQSGAGSGRNGFDEMCRNALSRGA